MLVNGKQQVFIITIRDHNRSHVTHHNPQWREQAAWVDHKIDEQESVTGSWAAAVKEMKSGNELRYIVEIIQCSNLQFFTRPPTLL